jgi:hypothetical protein
MSAALTLTAWSGPASATSRAAPAGSTATAAVRGDVVAVGTGRPIPGATIELAIPGGTVSVRSAADGTFAFPRRIATAAPYRRITAEVTAPGRGPWRITGAPLYPSDTLILHAELGSAPFTDRVLTPVERAARGIGGAPGMPKGDAQPTGNTCSGWDRQLVPTPSIWVFRTKTGISEKYGFAFYASHVLPNEWISSWDADSLGAGAVAVRTYAGWRAMTGHAYSSGANCADVRDTIDGYFDPAWTTAAAEQAVYATWGSVVYQNGGLFVAHYFAGDKMQPCAYVTGQYLGWMAQWGTQNCALGGVLWPEIVDTFYSSDTTPTSWHYTRNLLLNPSIASDPLYPFHAKASTFTRESGVGADGGWYLHAVPDPGRTATLYQQRPFLGDASTAYHDAVSLRCPGNAPCDVTLRVLAFPHGGDPVIREKAIVVPNDGAWHRYSFDPEPFGVDHASVRASVACAVPFDEDLVFLSAPFGGP